MKEALKDITVVTWDASFRESLHWFDCMHKQTDALSCEFIWVDYYNISDSVKAVSRDHDRFQLQSMQYPKTESWHLGRCVNHGVAQGSAQWLLLTDGDIVVGADFLERIAELVPRKDEAVYFRRFDEPCAPVQKRDKLDIAYLSDLCVLNNPTNFGACVLLHRNLFERVGGYEEHGAFCGPGISSMEFNVRLRNAGAAIRWSEIPTYHPWHDNTGLPNDTQELERLKLLAESNPWLLPYAGIEQSWIVRCRNLEIDATASSTRCDDYLAALPEEFRRG